MKKALKAVALVALLSGFGTAARAQPPGRWEALGEAHVDGMVDHDRITVGRGDGRFRAIVIRVRGGAIEFDRVVIHFGDGESDPIPIRSRIPNGGQTRVIDLPGNRRIIRSVEFWYRKENWRARPTVRLFGLR